MYEKYYSLAQSYSTQYLEAQVRRLRNHSTKLQAFHDALQTRPHAITNLRLLISRGSLGKTRKVIQKAMIFLLFFTTDLWAQNYCVQQERDIYSGISTTFMLNNYVSRELELAGGAVRQRNGELTYLLAVHYVGSGTLNPRSLEISIHETTFRFDTVVRRSRRGSSEIAGFSVSPEIFRLLGNGNGVSVKLYGDRTIEQNLDETVSERFKNFYETHIR
jgi:hypothetical protein